MVTRFRKAFKTFTHRWTHKNQSQITPKSYLYSKNIKIWQKENEKIDENWRYQEILRITTSQGATNTRYLWKQSTECKNNTIMSEQSVQYWE